MANLVITAANVVAGADAQFEQLIALAALTAGQALYQDTGTLQAGLADNDSANAMARAVRGIALHAAAIGQPIVLIRQGLITMGATLVVGEFYFLSATAGALCPRADLVTGNFGTLVGMAVSTSQLRVSIQSPGVALG